MKQNIVYMLTQSAYECSKLPNIPLALHLPIKLGKYCTLDIMLLLELNMIIPVPSFAYIQQIEFSP